MATFLVLVLWRLAQWSVTVAHEGGHAIFGSLLGGTIGPVVYSRTAGAVTPVAGLRRTGNIVTGLAGYLGPSLFGLCGALLLVHDKATAVLWISLLFLFLMLLQVALKNAFGAVVVVGTGVVIFLVARYASDSVQTMFAYTWVWFLLIGGCRDTVRLLKLKSGTDANILRELTHMPAVLFRFVFALATLAALVLGAGILLELVAVP
jgi:hypothetical protein